MRSKRSLAVINLRDHSALTVIVNTRNAKPYSQIFPGVQEHVFISSRLRFVVLMGVSWKVVIKDINHELIRVSTMNIKTVIFSIVK